MVELLLLRAEVIEHQLHNELHQHALLVGRRRMRDGRGGRWPGRGSSEGLVHVGSKGAPPRMYNRRLSARRREGRGRVVDGLRLELTPPGARGGPSALRALPLARRALAAHHLLLVVDSGHFGFNRLSSGEQLTVVRLSELLEAQILRLPPRAMQLPLQLLLARGRALLELE